MTPTTMELAWPNHIPDDLYASGRIIQHPRFQELHARITECLEATADDGEPQCLCLIGETGVGKTTLVRSYAAAFPRYETRLGTRTPILYLETPHPITVKGMTSALLHALGDPRAFKGTQAEMNARLQSYLADCGTRLVILDDFHHLIDKQTNRILRDVSEWLKVLIKNTGIVYLVVGIEGEVERILTANLQLSRLFVRERLRPFPWQPGNPETISDFARLISYVQTTLSVSLAETESLPVLLFRIHQATAGVMSHIMNLFRQANRIQRRQGDVKKPLTLDILAAAYAERLQAHVGRNNPFAQATTTIDSNRVTAANQTSPYPDPEAASVAQGT
jgi:energy-coupling factor transporter ATP-binding protein EcfA2